MKTKHPYYNTWRNMKQRCTDTNHPQFADYGGRGISVCDAWSDFWTFASDMGERPDSYTLDRIDNDLGYCPENCRWASRHQQALNQRRRKVMAKSGYKGVKRAGSRWVATAYVRGSGQVHLGRFSTPEEAAQAVKQVMEDA